MFRSTPPVRGATVPVRPEHGPWHVSIHAPVRGATPLRCHRRCRLRGFDPRPRAGSDAVWPGQRAPGRVSIHAPVRGATRAASRHARGLQVSIHAPVRGATRHCPRGDARQRVSIHAPVRGATPGRCEPPVPRVVSIHAPVRGATLPRAELRHVVLVSIHAPVRGATRCASMVMGLAMFRSTPPCGERRCCWAICPCRRSFDPRPRAGSDPRPSADRRGLNWFRSTPPCGERPRAGCHAIIDIGFDPRPRAGSDVVLLGAKGPRPVVSIHAPVRGATVTPPSTPWSASCFDPRPRAGSDLDRAHGPGVHGVSIHAPVRGATTGLR